jgi:hypothetical protein
MAADFPRDQDHWQTFARRKSFLQTRFWSRTENCHPSDNKQIDSSRHNRPPEAISTILIRLLRWPRRSGTTCRERNPNEKGRCPEPFSRLFREWTDGRSPNLSPTMGPDARRARRDRPLDAERGAGTSCRATDRDADGGFRLSRGPNGAGLSDARARVRCPARKRPRGRATPARCPRRDGAFRHDQRVAFR